MSAIFLERAVVHYEVLGRGRPMLFLHDWVGSWRYWIPVMQAASSQFRTYAIDLWGFGDSARDAARYSLAQQLELVNSFLEEMGIARLALVGHGLGAILALMFARAHPDHVDRVMAVSCPMENHSISPRLDGGPMSELADWLLDHDPLADAVRLEVPKTDLQAVQKSLADLEQVDVHTLWKELETACLLVHGKNDPLVPLPITDPLADLPYMVHAVCFEQSGHYPMITEGSKFNRLVADFLALESGDSPRQLQVREEWKRRVR
jgi:pimeloyl-ACP methyl ester carboxylesterase